MALHQRTTSTLVSSARYTTIAKPTAIRPGSTSWPSTPLPRKQPTWRRFLRPFNSTPHHCSNSLLNLSGLSVSRESRFLSKERGIPRTEFSPHLELIRSSEVEPFTGKGAPQAATSDTPLVQGNESGDSVSYLMKELENARRDCERSEAALRGLRDRYRKREREAAALAVVTAALTLGLVFSRESWALVEPVLRRWQKVQEDMSAVWARMITKSDYPVRERGRGGATTADVEEDTGFASAVTPIRGSVWSRFLWASPD